MWGVVAITMEKMANVSTRTIPLIERVSEKNLKFLADRELWWLHQLRVFVENGGNDHCYRKEFK